MATAFTPFGFVPVYHPSGLDRPTEITPFVVGSRQSATSPAFALAKFDPINVTNGNVPFAASASGNIDGVFLGCEYTNSTTGRREVTPYLAASTPLVDPVFWILNDAATIYEVLASNSGNAATAATSSILGNRYDQVIGTPSAITVGAGTGLSGAYLQVGAAQVAAASFQVIDHGWDAVAQGAWYDASTNTFPILRVKLVASGFPVA